MAQPQLSRRLLLGGAAAGALVGASSVPARAAAASRSRGHTQVFAPMPAPGYPAYVHAHTNGRVYAGTYIHSGSTVPSKVVEWNANGAQLRSWSVPGQVLGEDHGVQVANQTYDGKLVLLETSTASILTLDLRTGRFERVVRFPDGAVPNYATWGPGGLFVTDFAQGVIWKVPAGSRTPQRWFTSPALSSVEFGTTGIRFRPGQRDLLITQQTSTDGAALPTNGHLYRLPIGTSGQAGDPADAVDLTPRRPARRLRDRAVGTRLRRPRRAVQPARAAHRERPGDRPDRPSPDRRQRVSRAVRHPVQRDLPGQPGAGGEPVRHRRRRVAPGHPRRVRR